MATENALKRTDWEPRSKTAAKKSGFATPYNFNCFAVSDKYLYYLNYPLDSSSTLAMAENRALSSLADPVGSPPAEVDDDIKALQAECNPLSGSGLFFPAEDTADVIEDEPALPSGAGIEFSLLRSKKSSTSEIVWMDLNSCEDLRRNSRFTNRRERNAVYCSVEECLQGVIKDNHRVRKFFAKKAEVERSYSKQLQQLDQDYNTDVSWDAQSGPLAASDADCLMCAHTQLHELSSEFSSFLERQNDRVFRALHQFDANAKYLLKYMEAVYKEEQQLHLLVVDMHLQCTNLVDEMAKQIDEREREQGNQAEEQGIGDDGTKKPGPYRWDAKQGKLVPMSDSDSEAAIFADLDEHESADAVAAKALALAQTSKKTFSRIGHDDLWLCMTVYQLGVAASQKALQRINCPLATLLDEQAQIQDRGMGGLLVQMLTLLAARERLLHETVKGVAARQSESWRNMPLALDDALGNSSPQAEKEETNEESKEQSAGGSSAGGAGGSKEHQGKFLRQLVSLVDIKVRQKHGEDIPGGDGEANASMAIESEEVPSNGEGSTGAILGPPLSSRLVLLSSMLEVRNSTTGKWVRHVGVVTIWGFLHLFESPVEDADKDADGADDGDGAAANQARSITSISSFGPSDASGERVLVDLGLSASDHLHSTMANAVYTPPAPLPPLAGLPELSAAAAAVDTAAAEAEAAEEAALAEAAAAEEVREAALQKAEAEQAEDVSAADGPPKIIWKTEAERGAERQNDIDAKLAEAASESSTKDGAQEEGVKQKVQNKFRSFTSLASGFGERVKERLKEQTTAAQEVKKKAAAVQKTGGEKAISPKSVVASAASSSSGLDVASVATSLATKVQERLKLKPVDGGLQLPPLPPLQQRGHHFLKPAVSLLLTRTLTSNSSSEGDDDAVDEFANAKLKAKTSISERIAQSEGFKSKRELFNSAAAFASNRLADRFQAYSAAYTKPQNPDVDGTTAGDDAGAAGVGSAAADAAPARAVDADANKGTSADSSTDLQVAEEKRSPLVFSLNEVRYNSVSILLQHAPRVLCFDLSAISFPCSFIVH
jgi:hypothetical protein